MDGDFPSEWAEIKDLAKIALMERKGERADSWVDVDVGFGMKTSFGRARQAYEEIRIKMRVIHSVKEADISTRILGKEVGTPIMIAPLSTMVANICPHKKNAFVEMAKACTDTGAIATVGHPITKQMDRTMADMGTTVFRFIKPLRDREKLFKSIRDAEKNGCAAVGIDVDSAKGLNESGDVPILEKVFAPMSPDELREARNVTRLPFIIKGVMCVEDAQACVDIGADAIIVSSHGGHTMDYLEAPLRVLPDIVSSVAGNLEVYIDTGVRRGTDVFKALALGANGVFIGRVAIWGLAVGGAEGLKWVLSLLNSELKRTMILTGASNLREITPDKLIT